MGFPLPLPLSLLICPFPLTSINCPHSVTWVCGSERSLTSLLALASLQKGFSLSHPTDNFHFEMVALNGKSWSGEQDRVGVVAKEMHSASQEPFLHTRTCRACACIPSLMAGTPLWWRQRSSTSCSSSTTRLCRRGVDSSSMGRGWRWHCAYSLSLPYTIPWGGSEGRGRKMFCLPVCHGNLWGPFCWS